MASATVSQSDIANQKKGIKFAGTKFTANKTATVTVIGTDGTPYTPGTQLRVNEDGEVNGSYFFNVSGGKVPEGTYQLFLTDSTTKKASSKVNFVVEADSKATATTSAPATSAPATSAPATETSAPTGTESAQPTDSATSTETAEPTAPATSTESAEPTGTETATPTESATPEPTESSTATAEPTDPATSTESPAPTDSAQPTESATPPETSAPATSTPAPTASTSAPATSTPSPTTTETSAPTPTLPTPKKPELVFSDKTITASDFAIENGAKASDLTKSDDGLVIAVKNVRPGATYTLDLDKSEGAVKPLATQAKANKNGVVKFRVGVSVDLSKVAEADQPAYLQAFMANYLGKYSVKVTGPAAEPLTFKALAGKDASAPAEKAKQLKKEADKPKSVDVSGTFSVLADGDTKATGGTSNDTDVQAKTAPEPAAVNDPKPAKAPTSSSSATPTPTDTKSAEDSTAKKSTADDSSDSASPKFTIDPRSVSASEFASKKGGVKISVKNAAAGTYKLTVKESSGKVGTYTDSNDATDGSVTFGVRTKGKAILGTYDVTVTGPDGFKETGSFKVVSDEAAKASGTSDDDSSESSTASGSGSSNGSSSGGSSAASSLPRTGGAELTGLAAGLGLLVIGGAAVVVTRRRVAAGS